MRAETGAVGVGVRGRGGASITEKTCKIKAASLKTLKELAKLLAKLVSIGEGTNYQQQE